MWLFMGEGQGMGLVNTGISPVWPSRKSLCALGVLRGICVGPLNFYDIGQGP